MIMYYYVYPSKPQYEVKDNKTDHKRAHPIRRRGTMCVKVISESSKTFSHSMNVVNTKEYNLNNKKIYNINNA